MVSINTKHKSGAVGVGGVEASPAPFWKSKLSALIYGIKYPDCDHV